MTGDEAIKKIKNLSFETGLEKEVSQIVVYHLKDYEEATAFFDDLNENGCVSGMITELIYYKDTYAFYDRHYHDIEKIRAELEYGVPVPLRDDHKNYYAWLGFEYTAYKIGEKIGV